MRRRETAPPPDAPPARFAYEDWADEQADGPAPVYWGRDRQMWWQIRAFQRYLAAKLAAGRER